MGESVTVLQENLVGIHVVKAFAAEPYEQQKYDRKAQELRSTTLVRALAGANGAWMSLYFTCTLGVILWFGGWEVIHGHLTAGGLTQFVLYMNQLAFPIRAAARVINSISRAISPGNAFLTSGCQSPVAKNPHAERDEAAPRSRAISTCLLFVRGTIPALKQVTIEATPGRLPPSWAHRAVAKVRL